MNPVLAAAALASVLATAAAFALLGTIRRQEQLAERLRAIRQDDNAPAVASRTGNRTLHYVAAIGTAVARSGMLSRGTLVQLEQTMLAAGLRGPNGLGLFVGFKLLLVVAVPAASWLGLHNLALSATPRNAAVAASAIIGLLAPDYYVRNRRAKAMRRLNAGLPDALDMMVICSEAGLGLEPALSRVAIEIAHAHPGVAEELSHVASELRVAADRRQALMSMGSRTGLTSLKRLGATLVQTLQYGTPLSQALRTLSVEMREEILIGFEERAARLPVLLTLPMIVFILPTVFMVVGGPAMIAVLAHLRQ